MACLVVGTLLILAGVGLFLYSVEVCFIVCVFAYPYQNEGIIAGVLGFVILIVGIVLLSTPGDSAPMPFLPYAQQPVYQTVYQQPALQPYPQPPGLSQVQQARRFCPSCGNWYPGEYRVCPIDGAELKAVGVNMMACPKCGAPVLSTDRFCAKCGFQGKA
jgi:ribosomal protein S27AE